MKTPDREFKPYVEIHLSDGRIERHELGRDPVILGRSKTADISLDVPDLAEGHVKFKRTGQGRWIVRNIHRQNLIFFNGRPITLHVLNDQDVLCLASCQIVFHDPTGRSDVHVDQTFYEDPGQAAHASPLARLASGPVHASVMPGGPRKSGFAAPVPAGELGLEPPGDLIPPAPEGWGTAGPPGREGNPLAWRKLFAQRWLILGVFALVALPGLGVVWTRYGPEYTAGGKLEIRPIVPSLVGPENGVIPFYEAFVNTQVAVVHSPEVIERIWKRSEVQETVLYRRLIDKGARLLTDVLMATLKVEHDERTQIIDVSLATREGRDSAVLVNAVLDEYVRYVGESSDQNRDRAYRQLKAERDSLKNEIDRWERSAAELRRQIGTGTPDKLISEKKIRLDAVEAEVDRIDQEILLAEWQLKRLQPPLDPGAKAGDRPTPVLNFEYDPEWRQLNTTLKNLSHELSVGLGHWGERHSRIVDLRAQVKFAERQLREREQQLAQLGIQPLERPAGMVEGEDNLTMNAVNLPQRIELLKYKRRLKQDSLRTQLAQYTRAFDNSERLADESETLKSRKQLLRDIQSRLDERELERKVPGSISVMSWAQAPLEPTADRRKKLSVLAVIGGLLAGLGVAHLRVRASRVIREAEDITPILDRPFLGQIPLLARGRALEGEDSLIEAECFRIIRTALLQRLSNRRGIVSVTSADGGVGKTTVASMLARSLAQCGKKILLVDADLRKPAIAERFGIDPEPGLLNSLMDRAAGDHVYIDRAIPSLSVLAAGTSGDGLSSELLADGAFASCLRRWRRDYEIVILDTPPVLPVADARIIAQAMDGTILVVREGRCRREDVVEAMASLETCGANVLGMVYIGTSRRGSRPYYYGYKPDTALEVRRG